MKLHIFGARASTVAWRAGGGGSGGGALRRAARARGAARRARGPPAPVRAVTSRTMRAFSFVE